MNNNLDKQYFDLLKYILRNGVKKLDRTGTGTLSVFGYLMRINMNEGFPVLTSKRMFIKGIIHELIWFLRGETNIKYLVENGVFIWVGDAYKNYINKCKDENKLNKDEFINKIKSDAEFANRWGDLGPIYGKQWRDFNGVDQIKNLINELKSNPDSRRLIVSSWNVSELDRMVLPPCHYSFQCYTSLASLEERKKWWCDSIKKSIYYAEDMEHEDLDKFNIPRRKISLKWEQRSVDTFLGLPFNITSYALLLCLIAKEVNMMPDELIFSGGDVHLYINHIEQAKEQLGRNTYKLPRLNLKNDSIFNIKYEDIEIINYQSDKILKGELSN